MVCQTLDDPYEGLEKMENSPRFSDQSSARFTEHFSASPPYHGQGSPPVPQYSDIEQEKKDDKPAENDDSMAAGGFSSAGLESVRDQEAEKEVAYPDPQPAAQSWTNGHEEPDDKRGRICGLRRKWAFLLLALIIVVILAIALGAGLGAGLKNNSNSSSSSPSSTAPASTPTSTTQPTSTPSVSTDYLVGGSINPSYYSTSGVFNGTGIALASQSFSNDLLVQPQGDVVIYFQYYDQSIRWIQLDDAGVWQGGSVAEVVVDNARNNTPISAVSFFTNGTSQWHIFYIDTDNYIRQMSNSNTTSIWVDGPLNKANLKANDQEQVGLQACWYGNDYGDSGYTHTPLPGSGPGSKYSNQDGMILWYAQDNTTFQSWGWRDGDAEWVYQQAWPNLNGHAGVGCYTWGGTETIYSMFVNQDNAVEFWWRDSDTNTTNTTSHPIGVWTKAAYEIPDVHPSTALGYTNFFYAQTSDNVITGYNITWGAENTTIDGTAFPVTSAIGGTRMSVTAVPTGGGGNNILVFCQQIGNQIVEYVRPLITGGWTSVTLPIPGTSTT